MQEKRNPIANALELCLSCTNPSIYVDNPAWTQCHGRNFHGMLDSKLCTFYVLVHLCVPVRYALVHAAVSLLQSQDGSIDIRN